MHGDAIQEKSLTSGYAFQTQTTRLRPGIPGGR